MACYLIQSITGLWRIHCSPQLQFTPSVLMKSPVCPALPSFCHPFPTLGMDRALHMLGKRSRNTPSSTSACQCPSSPSPALTTAWIQSPASLRKGLHWPKPSSLLLKAPRAVNEMPQSKTGPAKTSP